MATNKTTQNRTHQEHGSSSQNRSHQQSGGREYPGMGERSKPVSDLFEQAMSSYEQAFQTGLKLQEESGRWWTMLLEQSAPSREWQKTVRTMANELLPEAQKRMEEGLRLVEQNSRASLEFFKLFKKTVEVPHTNPVAESQTKLLSFWETSLDSMRDSAQAVAQANTQALESWMEILRKSTDMAAQRVRA